MKIFLDTTILIEFEKNTRKELFVALLKSGHELYINSIVAGEYLHKLLGVLGGKSPLSVRESKKVKEILESHDTEKFLEQFHYLSIPKHAVKLSIQLMKKYNLLSNDALIVASCQLQDISILANYDSDFIEACRDEDITLLQKPEDLLNLR